MRRTRKRTAGTMLPPEKGATAARLYAALKHEILELILPPSAPIEEVRLGERFGCSRTPIREALTRLAAEGLVELRTNRSAIVAPITVQSMAAYFEALAYVSSAVACLAATRRTEPQLAEIRHCQQCFGSLLREKREFDRGDRNRDFHMAVGAAANNRFLAEQYQTLLDRGVRLANIPFYSEEDEGDDVNAHFRQASDDHDEIIRAIAKRDAARVETITLAHVELFRHRIAKFLSQYGSSLIEGHVADHPLPKLRHAPAPTSVRRATSRSRAEVDQ